MSKSKRRLSKKFKRMIGISAASLFLLSAVIVALIPQRSIKADDPLKETLLDSENQVPVIADTDKIYTTGDGMFQFAYITKQSGANRVAVICGYDFERSLSGGSLVIPDTVDAYTKYTDSQGTSGGYVAVSKNDEPLFYPVYAIQQVHVGDDEEGNPIYEDQNLPTGEYLPCYYNTIDKWIVDENNVERIPEKYYYKDASGNYKECLDEVHKRITNATVNYIANQNVVKTDSGWELSSASEDGIFSKAKNIVNVTFGDQMLGIGNYAFANCSNLSSVTFNDGINTIGNYAFSECHNLNAVNIPDNAAISVIGDHAFYNCQGLKSFTLPTGVEKVGDSCFEGCVSMTECIIDIPDKNMSLNKMGRNVFKNCSKLEAIEFPVFYNEDQLIAWFEGCNSLTHITIPNINMNITDDSTFTFDDFQNIVPQEFYLEGVKDEKLHKTSTANSFAFKYLDEEIYEKVYTATGGDDGTGKTVFQVNDQNQLIYFFMDDTVKKVQIPDTIGPYKITKIGSDSFKDNHALTQITIPSSIVEIESNAFKGCHELKDVIFKEPINLTYIGSDAFDTQDVDTLNDTCTLSTTPSLSFTGVAKMDSAPFAYAMDKNNNINNDNQVRTYITFYTGWPTNLTVEYNPETDERELVDCPTLDSIASIGTDTYPYITTEMANAAHTAKTALDNGASLTDNQKAIINSALNVILPDGIQAIKEGLFSGVDSEGNVINTPNTDIITITTEGLDEIDAYAFSGCDSLQGAYINGPTEKIGDYAFEDCTSLVDVDIYSNLEEIGLAPFKGDIDLKGYTDKEGKYHEPVDFGGNSDFKCEQCIIYGVNGSDLSIIEVLPARGLKDGYGSGLIDSKELNENVKSIKESAFEDCDGITRVDFSGSNVTKIPDKCFKGTDDLYSVTLKDGTTNIGAEAFAESNIRELEVPRSTSIIDNSAFDGDSQLITFVCEEDSPAAYYADNHSNIIVSDKPVEYHVYYYDEDTTTLLDTQLVKAGTDAISYVTPTKAGYTFVGWYPEPVNVTNDMKTYAKYQKNDEITYTVTFIDYDDSIISTQTVAAGGDAIEIKDPTRDGYTFTGWRPAITNIQENTKVYAQYDKKTSNNTDPVDPNNNNNNNGNNGNNNNGNNNNGTNNNGTNGTSALYTVTVVDGSGSGSYVSGASVIITANNPPSGKVFDKWKVDEGVSVLKDTMAATYFIMPAKNVTVTATYKDDTSKNNSNNNNSNNNNNNGTGSTKPNTTVSLTKTGFSNNGLASATVSGSSDNYVLKITESASAKAEIEDALMAEYDTLDNIKYVAMDISLYDSTGSAKIENTDDLKVSVTLPIPDDLVQYAGNNKVAYVVNGKLVKLDPKFTTINGVPCITFVAPHFSPYTIYVDTKDLSSSVSYTSTSTPKTGDGIGVKWFISLGLLAMAGLLFAVSIPTGKKRKVTK